MRAILPAAIVTMSALGLWSAVDPVDIREWEVPIRMDGTGALFDEVPSGPGERTRPRDPYVHPDGRVFFCGQGGNYIASFNPATETFERYALGPNTHPHNLIVDADGMVWYAGNTDAHIGRLDPATGAITKYPMPDPTVRDPHTLIWDRDGNIWFTAQGANHVGKLDVATGTVTLVPVPTRGARPYGIVMDPSGAAPWIVLFGTNKLATVDPTTMTLTEYSLPRDDTRPRRLQVGADGGVWYVDYAGGLLGRFDPQTTAVTEWPMPGGPGSRPYALVIDDDDRLWAFEGPRDAPVRLVGFDPSDETFFSITSLGSGPGTVRHAYYHEPDNTIWFGTDANTVGRATLP